MLLITDGEETCDGDPAEAIESLKEQGIDVRINIIGFAIDDEGLKGEFERWADLGGGRYFDAQDAEELAASVQQALRPKFQVLDATGSVLTSGTAGEDTLSLPVGTYTIKVLTSPPQIFEAIRVESEQQTEVNVEASS